ncbi:MAG: flagellar biosynthesis protein FliL [Gammaproteobacteria bacterium]|nr:flagellar biosynthesis protein FliL [Gammaproteobacteria bacterium]
MADEKLDEELDLGIENNSGSKKKLIILIAVGLIVLLGAGGGVAWFMLGGDPQPEGEEAGQEEVAEVEVEEKTPLSYHPLDPQFIVNLPPGGKLKMLQIGVQVATRQPELIDFIKLNDPMIRNALLNLFGSQEGGKLLDRKGKEQLQATVLKSLNKIVKDQGGAGEFEAVYFTSFVMQ